MNLMENLVEVAFLKKEVKRRSMVFQCELKEDLTKKLGCRFGLSIMFRIKIWEFL